MNAPSRTGYSNAVGIATIRLTITDAKDAAIAGEASTVSLLLTAKGFAQENPVRALDGSAVILGVAALAGASVASRRPRRR